MAQESDNQSASQPAFLVANLADCGVRWLDTALAPIAENRRLCHAAVRLSELTTLIPDPFELVSMEAGLCTTSPAARLNSAKAHFHRDELGGGCYGIDPRSCSPGGCVMQHRRVAASASNWEGEAPAEPRMSMDSQ